MLLRARAVGVSLLLLLSLTVVACADDPPEKEIQQADAAIATAQTAGADRYAADELSAARQAVQRARDAVAARDYRLALNHALDGRDRAQTATAQTATAVAVARGTADAAISAAVTAVTAAASRLSAVEAAHASPRAIAGPRSAVTHAEMRVQEARTAWAKGDFATAESAANDAAAGVAAVSSELDGLLPAVRRRR